MLSAFPDCASGTVSTCTSRASRSHRPSKTRFLMQSALAEQALLDFVARYPRLYVLTGAGCSTDSGIPDYRDAEGEWKRRAPIMLQAFVGNELARKRYWARSLAGFRRMRHAQPNDAHRALASLERNGRIVQLVTQNVDGLHQAAGSQNVIDLHGRIHTV